MARDEIIMVCCSDIAGQLRGKGCPVSRLAERAQRGVGWTPTNIMITCHGAIAPGPWGAFDDLILRPDPATRVRVEFPAYEAIEQFVLGDIMKLDGAPWECCLRDFAKRALAALESEAGLALRAAFEHEFHYSGVEEHPNSAYNLDAFRRQGGFAETFLDALAQAGLEPDTFMPEYGPCQYEITVAPKLGLRAADEAVILREMARASARCHDARASFVPLVRPDAVGNGVHVHFSVLDAQSGEPVNYDREAPHGVHAKAGAFIAGVLDKLPALTALTAASPISYLRLVPHRWSAAYNNFGAQDREAGVRLCPVFTNEQSEVGREFHFELRAADATASPYMVLGGLVWAGLDGIRRGRAPPSATRSDPAAMSAEALASAGLVRLPESLDASLDLLEADADMKQWMGPVLHDAYLAHKRFELELVAEMAAEERCRRYMMVY